jgi:diadenosine tetraphosphate (Ap4A) HIT family hydrolase
MSERLSDAPSRDNPEAMVGHPGGVGLSEGCLICQGLDGDRELGRFLAWEDDVWRVTISLKAPVVGFAYLEPKRHIPHITDLDDVEATTLGPILARVTRILVEETGAELIYVNVFGERVPHLHFNLAPHRTGDPLAGGAGMIIGEPPPQPEHTLRKIANQLARRLRD